MNCPHEDFEAHVAVNRLTGTGGGDITGYAADVTIRCMHCNTPFRFLGLPGGLAPDKPTVSVDGTEARLPIAPQGEDVHLDELIGYSLTMH